MRSVPLFFQPVFDMPPAGWGCQERGLCNSSPDSQRVGLTRSPIQRWDSHRRNQLAAS